jgi:hypothetical protein
MSENKGRFTESGRKWERKGEEEREREREREREIVLPFFPRKCFKRNASGF